MNPRLQKLVVLLLPLLAGCSTLDLNFPEFGEAPDRSAQVSNIQCVWQSGEGIGLDNMPSRGFAGQVLFFVRGEPEPVPVNCDVRVYVFDDQGTVDEQAKPIHEFNFPAAVWSSYRQETNLGPAYHVFIPYTRKGGMAASCAVRVRMTAEGRPPVYSQLATISLPGRRAASEPAVISSPEAVSETHLRESLTTQAAIQRTRAELGLPDQSGQLRRLHQAASAVQTADFSEADATAAGGMETADFETEEPVSRRYRMSGGDRAR
ncbi:MAG: hypothetical protein JNG89_04675 [Planctomycetaceae bacterium]|nr:hypothetical protein [Planctomycetaceae bacterium]